MADFTTDDLAESNRIIKKEIDDMGAVRMKTRHKAVVAIVLLLELLI